MAGRLALEAAFALLLPCTAWGLQCAEDEYPLGALKCCKQCPPGFERRARCTHSTETICEPCDEYYYNAVYTQSQCKRCAVCDKERGLQEVKPCDRFSNTRCICRPGYEQVSSQATRGGNQRCEPCPIGYFSQGGLQKCHPWTNCTAKGLKLLRAGREGEDAICEDQASKGLGPAPTVTLPTSIWKEGGVRMSTPTWMYTSILTTRPTEGNHSVVYLGVVIGAVLLFVTGGVILWLCFQKAKKQPRGLGPLSDVLREGGRSSCRVPIQEEQVDCKSSLTRN